MSAEKAMRVYCGTRGLVALTPPFGDGGEATVHAVHGHPGLAAKVYKPGERPQHLKFLLETIRSATRGVEGVCRVEDVLHSHAGGEAVGYLMPRIHGTPLGKARFGTVVGRVAAARGVLRAVSELIERGLLYTDLHGDNVLLCGWWGTPVLIDIDSLSVPDLVLPDGTKYSRYLAKGMPGWPPPEHWGLPPADVRHDARTLAHTAAVLVWTCLKDEHPAQFHDRDGDKVPLSDHLENL